MNDNRNSNLLGLNLMVLLSSVMVHFCEQHSHLTLSWPLTNLQICPVCEWVKENEIKWINDKKNIDQSSSSSKTIDFNEWIINATYNRTNTRSKCLLMMTSIKSNFTLCWRFQPTLVVLSFEWFPLEIVVRIVAGSFNRCWCIRMNWFL